MKYERDVQQLISFCFNNLGSGKNKCARDIQQLISFSIIWATGKIKERWFGNDHVWPFFVLDQKLNNPLQWRHNEHDSVSNQQPNDCLLNRLFGRRSKKTSKLRVTGLCAGNPPGTGEFPAQRASNAEKCFHLMTSSWQNSNVPIFTTTVQWRQMNVTAFSAKQITSNSTSVQYHIQDNIKASHKRKDSVYKNKITVCKWAHHSWKNNKRTNICIYIY